MAITAIALDGMLLLIEKDCTVYYICVLLVVKFNPDFYGAFTPSLVFPTSNLGVLFPSNVWD